MKSFLKWAVALAGAGIGAVVLVRAVKAGRERLKEAVTRAEQITDQARSTLEQTDSTLRSVRDAI